MTWSLVIDHLFLVLAASVLSILIGIPLGILAYMFPKIRKVILTIVDILQTIPALALLGMIMILVGPGQLTVVIGITLYSLLPIVQNTCVGLTGVDPGVQEAARGVGMTQGERLFRVELPLAFPTIFTGIRIAIVNAIGTAVFAAFVGGGGIGDVMYHAIRIQNMRLILISTGVLMLIAVVLDFLMSFSESLIRKSHNSMKRVVSSIVIIFVAFAFTIPFEINSSDEEGTLVLYNGDYTETQIVHHMVKYLVEDKTDLNVTIKDQMSQVNNYKALIGDDHTCDLMCSYDGTLLTTFLHKDPKDVPKNQTLFNYVNRLGQQKEQITLLGKLGFNNTYAIAVPQKIAKKYNLKTISDLKKVDDKLVFGGEHEFFTEEGSAKYKPFVKFYGLHFKQAKSIDVSLKYSAIQKNEIQVTDVFATDGMNKKLKLVILKDDRQFFPEYNGSLLVRNDTFQRFSDVAPNLRDVLCELNGKISTQQMQDLCYEVDIKGKSIEEVARSFLKEKGLID
ncbi:MAG: glycine betaine ABC transporter substrate-binding protein [Anaerovoracaceae bacterium]|jgi:osmoprotectant transport system permease protein